MLICNQFDVWVHIEDHEIISKEREWLPYFFNVKSLFHKYPPVYETMSQEHEKHRNLLMEENKHKNFTQEVLLLLQLPNASKKLPHMAVPFVP